MEDTGKQQIFFGWDNELIQTASAKEKVKRDPKINPCITLYGAGPEGTICNDCVHLYGIAKAKIYYKCDLRKGNNSGASTDHKTRWPACGKFEKREENDRRLYDGRL